MELGIKGKRALVCGGSSGLGFAIAKSLLAEGAEVIITSRSIDKLRSAETELRKSVPDSKIEVFASDFSVSGDAKKLGEHCISKGGVDILVCNSGGPAPSSALKTSREAWVAGFQNLFLSFVELTQILIEPMLQKKYGRIIGITSTSVVEPIDNLVVSTSLRAAYTAYCKALATEVAQFGVTVNTIMPGVVHTARIENLRRIKAETNKTTLEEEFRHTSEGIPTKRMGLPEEFAAMATFLASKNASYITGANHVVDGGLRKSWV